jgi:hypothetical protein
MDRYKALFLSRFLELGNVVGEWSWSIARILVVSRSAFADIGLLSFTAAWSLQLCGEAAASLTAGTSVLSCLLCFSLAASLAATCGASEPSTEIETVDDLPRLILLFSKVSKSESHLFFALMDSGVDQNKASSRCERGKGATEVQQTVSSFQIFVVYPWRDG